MRVLIAPDCFTGSLTAVQAAEAVAAGWRAQAPDDELAVCPLSDGGPGFLGALHVALGGQLLEVDVPGPLGEVVPAQVLLVAPSRGQSPGQSPHHADAGPTAYLESAQACGLHLVPKDRRDPTLTSSAGVGALLEAALKAGATRIVVGLGGSGTVDGGAGALAALGVGDPAVLGRGGGSLAELADDALAGLAEARARFAGVELVAASDVTVPLLGFHGAAAGFAEQKGATPEQAQHLGRALGRYAEVALATLGPDVAPQALVAQPGAGAAGGLGFALLLLGARRESGAEMVLEAVGFSRRLEASDLVVTGEGCFDWQSVRGKVVSVVARQALPQGVPVVVIAGRVEVGRREMVSIGIEAAYALAENPAQFEASMANPVATLTERARRVARTWSR